MDIPQPRSSSISEAVIETARSLDICHQSREETLLLIGRELGTWKAFFGSLRVMLHMDPSKSPLEVLDAVKKIIDENETLQLEIRSLKSK